MKKAEIIARYGEEAYQRKLERKKQWNQDNKEKIAEKNRQYYQDHKEEIAEQHKQYHQDNKEKIAEWQKQWREDNPEYHNRYYQTPKGRAVRFCSNYQRVDRDMNRGECTLTPDYIVEHIFPNGCLYCGEKDWTKLGCDRVDNDLPHTPDNVVCCCTDCNKKRGQKGFDMFLYKSWRKRFA